MGILSVRDGDLSEYPEICQHDETHVTLGDLHGNALKLVYTLLEEGIFTGISHDNYRALYQIYQKDPSQLTRDDLTKFRDIIEHAVVNPQRSLTLIGDELADRGQNDYFTLLVLDKLRRAQCHVEVMISNHSVEFISNYEEKKEEHQYDGHNGLGPKQATSLTNMVTLVNRGLVTRQQITELVNNSYRPRVKAIGYTVNPNGDVTIYTHAPIGLETIKKIAEYFKLAPPYDDSSPGALLHTIDQINLKVQQAFESKQLSEIFLKQFIKDMHVDVTRPLYRLIWNRSLGKELETKPRGDFGVVFTHGHVGDDGVECLDGIDLHATHTNLDSSFGKPGYEKSSDEIDIRNQRITRIQQVTLRSSETQQLTEEISFNFLLRSIKKYQFGEGDIAMKTYLTEASKRFSDGKNLAEKQALLQELEDFHKQLISNQALNFVEKTVADFRDKAGVFTVGMRAKANQIEQVIGQMSLEARLKLHTGESTHHAQLMKALATHRHLGKSGKLYEQDGVIDTKRAAQSYRDFLKVMHDPVSSHPEDTPTAGYKEVK